MSAAYSNPQVSPEPQAVKPIREARERHEQNATGFQNARRYFVLLTAIVGPVAVTLLVLQVTLSSPRSPLRLYLEANHGLYSKVLIGAEACLLLFALATGFLGFEWKHKPWIKERLRTELLRREEFLLLARVGPYLGVRDESMADCVNERLVSIDRGTKNPVELIHMGDDDLTWRHALEDAWVAKKLEPIPALESIARLYLDGRILNQREWFAKKSEVHHEKNENKERWAKSLLIGALILSIIHFTQVGAEADVEMESLWTIALIVLAICTPAFGAMFASLQSISGSERLSRSFLYHAEVLEDFESRLRKMLPGMASHSPNRRDVQFQFMRLVLEVEELLSQELRTWWLVMYPNVPKAGA